MLVKVHRSYRDVVSICDSEIIGKTFEEGNRLLDLRESFYDGELKSEPEAIEIMKHMSAEDATFNIAGKKAVEAAKKAGIITEEGIGKIQGIPFALILL